MGYPADGARVRWNKETACFELRCRSCGIYVTLDTESWIVKAGLTRCRACWTEYKRLHEAGRRKDDIVRQLHNTRNRLRYWDNREYYLTRAKAWREANKDRVREYNRAYREEHKERDRETRRAYYILARDAILIKKKQAYERRRKAA